MSTVKQIRKGQALRSSAAKLRRAAARPPHGALQRRLGNRAFAKLLAGRGEPLGRAARAFFEPRFGVDFSDVRVHAGGEADRSARSIDALAYTAGNDIVFRASRYDPSSEEGRHLLAHELAHVAQHKDGTADPERIARRVDPARVSCHGQAPGSPVLAAIGTDDPFAAIEAADARAIDLLTNVIGELSDIRARVAAGEPPAWPLIADAVAEAMRVRLRLNPDSVAVWTGNGPGTVEIAIRWYRNILDTLTGGRLRYICLGPTCEAGDRARAAAGISRIRLCRDWWHDPEGMAVPEARALSLIHEIGHIYYDTEDVGGGLGNSHCLTLFVSDLNGLALVRAACTPP